MRNPYFVLGVQPDAGKDDIKSAFRRLAMAFHPDKNPGDFVAHERFAEISAAYQLLSDGEKRRLYDAGLIDIDGRRRASKSRRRSDAFAGAEASRQTVEPGPEKTPEDVAERIFGEAIFRDTPRDGPFRPKEAATRRERVENAPGLDDVPTDSPHDAAKPTRGLGLLDRALKPFLNLIGGRESEAGAVAETELELTVPLGDIIQGAEHMLDMPDGETARIRIEPGMADGTRIRLAGRGTADISGNHGDAVVVLRFERSAGVRAEGLDIHVEVPVSLDEAVFGASRQIVTPDGAATVTIPEWSDSGCKIRIAGRGLPDGEGKRGDLVAELRLMLPEGRDERLTDLLRLQRGDWFV